jgi:hypothetical protein
MDLLDISDHLNEAEYKCTALADLLSGLPECGLCKDTPHGLFLLMRGIVTELKRINAELRRINDEMKAANET